MDKKAAIGGITQHPPVSVRERAGRVEHRPGWSVLRRTRTLLIGRLLIVIGALVGSLAVAIPQASATPMGAFVIRNWETGRCLDSNLDGAVYTSPCTANNDYQRWSMELLVDDHGNEIKNNGYNVVTLIDVATGQSHQLGSRSPYGPEVNTSDSQYNYWVGNGPDWQHVRLVNSQLNTNCLDSNYNGDVYLIACNGGGFQQWHFE